MTQEEVASATNDELQVAFKAEQAKMKAAAENDPGSQAQLDAAAASTIIGNEILRRKSLR